uniref:Uncharacterized protein n=1 Tax=Romanomermis culicivorax TaxID=13658 RepID=A0A915KIA2_ROMCU
HVSEFLYHVIKSAKSTIGGLWFSSSNDTQTLISDDQVPDDPNIDTNQTANDVINLINQLLNSPLVAMKHNLSLDQIFQNPDHQKNNVRILSPRLFPLFESKSNTADSFLSPDILALYDDRSSSSNSFSQILRNFSQSNHNDKFWSKFLSELSGVSDLIKLTKKTNLRKFLLKKSKIETGYDGIDIATNKIYDIYDKMKVSDIYKMLNAGQMTQLNSKGY